MKKERQLAGIFSLLAAFFCPPVFGVQWQVRSEIPAGHLVTNSVGMSFAYIPDGRFLMGSAWEDQDRQYDEHPHQVRLTKAIWMGTTEVTQGQWKAIMGDSRAHFSGDNLPVESVSWADAVAFCEKLSRKEGRSYRLPTESEWEYACRAGGKDAAAAAGSLDELAWFARNSEERTRTAGTKKSNAWGLFDMLGNVSEWCLDTFEANYPQEEVVDPVVRSERGAKVVRGGSWGSSARSCRCQARNSMPGAYQEKETGLRVVMLSGQLPSRDSIRVQSWVWLGEAIPYPDPTPREDVSAIGETYKIWFAGVGPAKRGDTFPMTWADDDHIYTSSGDPHWGQKATGLDVERFSGMPPRYYISKVNEMDEFVGNGGEGPKPTGMISVDGVLYLAFQNMLGKKRPVHGTKSQHGSDAAIVSSSDLGKTWRPSLKELRSPMFPGAMFGGPAFVNFGKGNENAPGGYVYAVSADQWDNGSRLRLGRVKKDRILDASSWEWVKSIGLDGEPDWTGQLWESEPVLVRDRQISLPEMVYIRSIERYLLLTWHLKEDFSPEAGSELFIYESPKPWGPFTLVHHEKSWEDRETTPYCPRLPLKWLRQSQDGVTGWLQFSGSWRQNSTHYRSHVRPFRLELRSSRN